MANELDDPKPLPPSRKSRPTQAVYRLESPYAPVKWPIITPETQSSILTLLCELLSPIGQQRAQLHAPSQGKRASRKRKRDGVGNDEQSETVPMPVPDIARFVTLGLNSTTTALESHGGQRKLTSTTIKRSSPATQQQLAVIFLLHAPSSLHYAHLILLSGAGHSPRIPVIPLHIPKAMPTDAAERQACTAAGLPRLSVVGVAEGAPGAEALMALVGSVPPMQEPGLDGEDDIWKGIVVGDGKSDVFRL